MEAFYKKSDEELIALIRTGQPELMDVLLDRYKNLVRKSANAMFLVGGETEDLIQEGMIGLFQAIRDYRPEKEANFYSFARLCISRQIIHAVTASQRKKHQPLNTYVSLDAPVMDVGEGTKEQEAGERVGRTLAEQLKMPDAQDPEQLLLQRERVDQLSVFIKEKLSELEQEVLYFYLQGYEYRQIARAMEKSPKTIDNALQRIKQKLSPWRDKQ